MITAVDLSARPARTEDLDALLDLARRRRAQYERYQPRFWRPAADAVTRQREFFRGLLSDEQAAVVVATEGARLAGFAIGRVMPAPPVYDPGGLTCIVDDFTVDRAADWAKAGPLLVAELQAWAATQGAVQIVVVTAHLDEPKRGVLRDAGLSLASEWWTGSV